MSVLLLPRSTVISLILLYFLRIFYCSLTPCVYHISMKKKGTPVAGKKGGHTFISTDRFRIYGITKEAEEKIKQEAKRFLEIFQ